jgi:hypothetical protein
MTTRRWLQLRWLFGLGILLLATAFAPTFAYDGQDQTNVAHDSGFESAIGYDVVPEYAADETKNGTTGSRVLFAEFAKCLAAKTIPNPGGRLGDVVTRQTTANVIRDLEARGFTTETEVLFRQGPLGSRNRFADVVGVNPQTGESFIINIGRQTQSGIPIMRERMALDDIIFSPTIKDYPNSRLLFIEKGASGLPPGL